MDAGAGNEESDNDGDHGWWVMACGSDVGTKGRDVRRS